MIELYIVLQRKNNDAGLSIAQVGRGGGELEPWAWRVSGEGSGWEERGAICCVCVEGAEGVHAH